MGKRKIDKQEEQKQADKNENKQEDQKQVDTQVNEQKANDEINENFIKWAHLFIAARLAKEKLSPIGSSVSFIIGLVAAFFSPEEYRWPLICILIVAVVVYLGYTGYRYKKLNQRCVDFPVQKRPARHFYTLMGGFEENMQYVMSEDKFKGTDYAFAMGIDQTLALDRSTKKGILSSVLDVLEKDYKVDINSLQELIYAESERLLKYKKEHSLPELIEFGDIIDVRVKIEKPKANTKPKQQAETKDNTEAKQEAKTDAEKNGAGEEDDEPKIHLLLIVNSKKKFSDEECKDPEKFESVKGIDSRIIIIRLFEYCQKKRIQNMMLGAMGTNGLDFPLYAIVREIVNAYCYWIGQLTFDSTSPLNIILSLRVEDITRHAGELSKIISYIDWMIERRKATITK